MRYLIMPVVIGCAAQQDKPIENLEEEILYCADGAYSATFSVWSAPGGTCTMPSRYSNGARWVWRLRSSEKAGFHSVYLQSNANINKLIKM